MGGHRKGGGGGSSRPGRNCNPEQRQKLSKKSGLALPQQELRTLGSRLIKQASKPYKDPVRPPTATTGGQDEDATPEAEDSRMSEMAAFALRARQAQVQFDAPATLDNGAPRDEHDPRREQSLRKFFKEFRDVLEQSDVLLEVLDARDPMGCRLQNVEKTLESQWGDRKTVILILNKADLVPSNVLDAWIEYFQSEQKIVLPFIAASEGTAHGHKRTRSVKRNTCITSVYKVLRDIGRGVTRGMSTGTGERKSLTVGVVGYPNVGKSSLINALRRKTVVGVGNTPGFTTGNTEVDLRKDVKVLDCPGVVMPGDDTGDITLRNAVKVEQLDNPIGVVARLFERCDPGLLSQVYAIDTGASVSGNPLRTVEEFVKRVGVRRGRLQSGGIVNELETARMIIQDWNDGRIGYFTLPPAQQNRILSANIASSSALATAAPDDEASCTDRVVLSSFSTALTTDGLPTFHLIPRESHGKKRERLAEEVRKRSSGGETETQRRRQRLEGANRRGLENDDSDEEGDDYDDEEEEYYDEEEEEWEDEEVPEDGDEPM